jgi:hypothetical protein
MQNECLLGSAREQVGSECSKLTALVLLDSVEAWKPWIDDTGRLTSRANVQIR